MGRPDADVLNNIPRCQGDGEGAGQGDQGWSVQRQWQLATLLGLVEVRQAIFQALLATIIFTCLHLIFQLQESCP